MNESRNKLYSRALELYRRGNWGDAADAFMTAAEHEPSARRVNPCVVMASRCESFALQGAEPIAAFVLSKG